MTHTDMIYNVSCSRCSYVENKPISFKDSLVLIRQANIENFSVSQSILTVLLTKCSNCLRVK
jgi:hypothetical protein